MTDPIGGRVDALDERAPQPFAYRCVREAAVARLPHRQPFAMQIILEKLEFFVLLVV